VVEKALFWNVIFVANIDKKESCPTDSKVRNQMEVFLSRITIVAPKTFLQSSQTPQFYVKDF